MQEREEEQPAVSRPFPLFLCADRALLRFIFLSIHGLKSRLDSFHCGSKLREMRGGGSCARPASWH